jgi:hypothetical protein
MAANGGYTLYWEINVDLEGIQLLALQLQAEYKRSQRIAQAISNTLGIYLNDNWGGGTFQTWLYIIYSNT